MDIKTLLGVTSAVVGAGVVVGQDPSFEYPAVKPVLNESSSTVAPIITCGQDQQKRVSVKFKNAPASEILDWLENQGVNFVIPDANKAVKIDLNASNVPLDELINSIGASLGGYFSKSGSTYVFHKGNEMFRFNGVPTMPLTVDGKNLPNLSELPKVEEFSMANGAFMKALQDKGSKDKKVWVFGDQDPKQMKELHERMMKEFGPSSDFMKNLHRHLGNSDHWKELSQEFMKEFSDGPLQDRKLSEQDAKKWEEHAKQMEKFGKEMEKRFGDGSEFQKKMELWSRDHAKQMEKLGSEMEKRFGDGSEFQKKMELWNKDHAKEMQQLGKEMQKSFGEGSKFQQEMKAFQLKDGKLRELDAKDREKLMKSLEGRMKDLKGNLSIPPMPPLPPQSLGGRMNGHLPMMIQGGDISAVAKSLTANQRKLQQERGFLYWSDLTKDQQAKLGMKQGSGNWTITYSKDGESFTVKSDKN